MPSDQNYDGYSDIVIEGLSAYGSLTDAVIVFASGKLNVSQPLGLKALKKAYYDFFGNLREWALDPNFFDLNTNVSYRPRFSTELHCDFGSERYGRFPGGCRFQVRLVGFDVNIGIGYDPDAKDFIDVLLEIFAERDTTCGSRWKSLSDAMQSALGVPSFGYQFDGSRQATNFVAQETIDDECSQIEAQLTLVVWGAPIQSTPPANWHRHLYTLSNQICSNTSYTTVFYEGFFGQTTAAISPSNCTLNNVFCWAKRMPGPRTNGSTATVSNGDISILWIKNPIRTFIFKNEDVLVNNTLDEHIFHDPIAFSDRCGEHANWQDIPDRCSYVHRDVTPTGTNIKIETHGEGYNPTIGYVLLNQIGGRVIFNGVDDWIRRRLALTGQCTVGE